MNVLCWCYKVGFIVGLKVNGMFLWIFVGVLMWKESKIVWGRKVIFFKFICISVNEVEFSIKYRISYLI